MNLADEEKSPAKQRGFFMGTLFAANLYVNPSGLPSDQGLVASRIKEWSGTTAGDEG